MVALIFSPAVHTSFVLPNVYSVNQRGTWKKSNMQKLYWCIFVCHRLYFFSTVNFYIKGVLGKRATRKNFIGVYLS